MIDDIDAERRFELAEQRARLSRFVSAGFFVAAAIAGLVLSGLSLGAKRKLDSLTATSIERERQNQALVAEGKTLTEKKAQLQVELEELRQAKQRQEDNLRSLTTLQNQSVLGVASKSGDDQSELEKKARADLTAAKINAELSNRKREGLVVVLGSYRRIENARQTVGHLKEAEFPQATVYLAMNGYYAVTISADAVPKATLERARQVAADAYLYNLRALPIELKFTP